MHRRGGPNGELILAATDLVGFLECGHLTNLERQAAAGLIHKPPTDREDPDVQLLQRRGHAHEQRYIDVLRERGREVVPGDEDWDHSYEDRAAATVDLMRRGTDVIYQATVFDGRWLGFPDFLLKTAGASALGDYHYEVADTKLAHTAKASALIQIASYVEQIARIQGQEPEHVYVVTGGAVPEEHAFRTAEMMAYYRHAKQRFEHELATELDPQATYPDPVEHCAVCKWYGDFCWRQWREDDALPLVAGVTRAQRQQLRDLGIATRGALAQAAPDTKFEKVHLQARLQVASDGLETPKYELLEPEQDSEGGLVSDRGLSALPPPAQGDLFFDIEGDPFAFWEGLEYLFGVWQRPQGDGLWDDGYEGIWALNRAEERRAFEQLMGNFMARWRQYPDMHIYHYGAYEPSHLKILAGRHATMEAELDELLRNRRFVDLYRVVRQGVRVGAESYSIKKLEPLYGYTREVELRDANSSIVEFETVLEVGDASGEIKEKIRRYNRDDCISTEQLRDWLEARRVDAQEQFKVALPRPAAVVDPTSEEFSARQAAVHELEERLTADVPADPTVQTDADRATWLLRHLLDWHRRENKSMWWRFYELMGMSEDELVDEAEPIGQLEFVGIVEDGGTRQSDDYRYRFPAQEYKVDVGDEVHDPEITDGGDTRTGGVVALDDVQRAVDIRRRKGWAGHHPEAIVPLNFLGSKAQQDALMRIGEWVAANGIDSDSAQFRAARDLLLRRPPRGIHLPGGETGSETALDIATQLDGTTLAIQGPPGSGKTWSGARMILKLIADGRRVGIAANSHKVITNLLNAVGEAADEPPRTAVRGMQKVDGADGCKLDYVKCVGDNKHVVEALASGEVDVVGGTAWLWSRDDMAGLIDTLFVDEAGQMSLANVVAMSGAARNIVLLGDPQQLDQPTQGVHPGGSGVSALAHLLGEHETVPPDEGLFLEKTWRMHPAITSFTSEQFYESKLAPVPGLDHQTVVPGGAGLRWVPVDHDGRTNASVEEADAVVSIVAELLNEQWINRDDEECPIEARNILVVSPFNAHRLLINQRLSEAGIEGIAVGTVDKFQGQEAAVSIYTMATSRPEDAPRGMAFLYSLNRLNVATSRARALSIVVCSRRLLDVVPASPDQLRMANAMSAFVEAAN